MENHTPIFVLIHEISHAIEKEVSYVDSYDLLQRWQQHMLSDQVSVSTYGDTKLEEDVADFGVVCAMCLQTNRIDASTPL